MENKNSKYKEGDVVLMKIHKTTILPDEQKYFVLLDPNNHKYLIEEKHYSDYNFKTGQNINCRIDKINCTGNIFFEPEHPLYKINKSYKFEVLEKKQIKNNAEVIIEVLLVQDVFQNKILIQEDKNSTSYIGDEINCRVDRIKKGKLFLSKTNSETKRLQKGETYQFEIISVVKPNKGDEYYKLKGPFGSIHKLPKEYYQSYNFCVGMTIQCKVEKFLSDIDYLLEPIHPFYKIGKVYDFEINGRRKEKNHFGEEREVVIVKDVLGKEGRVLLRKTQEKTPISDNIIKCKVLKLIKATVVLEMI